MQPDDEVKYRVMLVEDEPPSMRILERMLERVECARSLIIVAKVANGREAMDCLDAAAPDLLFSDIKMPLMDGFALAEQVHIRRAGVQLVFLTAYDEFAFAQKALRLGSVDYLLKPVDGQELEAALRRMMHAVDALRAVDEVQTTGRAIMEVNNPVPDPTAEAVARRITEHIHANFTQPIKLNMLAARFGISYPYLSTLYKRVVGVSPSKHIVSLRIERAKEIIAAHPDLPFRRIAVLVGYEDAHYFSRLFRSATGQSLSEFRDQHLSGEQWMDRF